MDQIELRMALYPEVTAVMEMAVGAFRSKGEQKALQWLRDNFSLEFVADPNTFVALPSEKRSYYFATNNGRQEALLSLSKGRHPSVVNLASFGRIVPKDSKTAAGWNYLEALMEGIVIPNGHRRLVALIMSRGGEKAFYDLQDNSQAKPYTVQVSPGNPGLTAMVIVQ